ncbi:hypothetical protein J6590_098601 [Homalodisca vitripennis]|nr:hypothetical protein J6590_098601 [Homalodisca vitripennis]
MIHKVLTLGELESPVIHQSGQAASVAQREGGIWSFSCFDQQVYLSEQLPHLLRLEVK